MSTAGEVILRYQVATPVSNLPDRVAEEYAQAVRYLLDRYRDVAVQPYGIGVIIPDK